METMKCKYVNVEQIQKEYLPISKKKIRCLVKKYLPAKKIGGRIFVERELLEELLSMPNHQSISLN